MRPGALYWVVGNDGREVIVAAFPVDVGKIVHFTRGDRSRRLTVSSDGPSP